jgi:hypothetical protein
MSHPIPALPLRTRLWTLVLAGCGLLALGTPLRAQRYVWVVPGTKGHGFQGVLWDRGTGTLVVNYEDRVLRLDPRDWTRREIARLNPGPDLVKLHEIAPAPGGAFVVNDYGPSEYGEAGGHQVSLVFPEGRVETVASDRHDQRYQDDTEDALDAGFAMTALAAGGDGRFYLADNLNARVFQIYPQEGKNGYGFRAIAGVGEDPVNVTDEEEQRSLDAGVEQALEAMIAPDSIARDPSASPAEERLAVAGHEQSRVHLLSRRSGPGGETWGLSLLAGAGGSHPGDGLEHADARNAHLNGVRAMAWGDDGTLHVLTADLLWSLMPPGMPEGGPWSCRAIAGAADGKAIVRTWLHPVATGEPAAGVPYLGQMKHLATVPGGGLLLTEGHEGTSGIVFIGPESDLSLARRVAAHREAEQAEAWSAARNIWEDLARLHRTAVAGHPALFGARFMALNRAHCLHSRLPVDLQRLVGSFLLDPRVATFRFALALEAIRAGSRFERTWILAEAQFRKLPTPEGAELPAPDGAAAEQKEGEGSVAKRPRTE